MTKTQIAWMVAASAMALAVTAEAAGTSSAQFLKMGAGARATAMGDAFVSAADDVTAAYWNPANLTQLKTAEVAMMQNTGLVDTQYQYLGAAMPVRNSAFGVSIYRLDHGSIDRYDVNDNKNGSFSAGSLAASLSMGTKMTENLMLGFSAKFISESIESESASTFAADLGGLYKMGRYNLAASVQNVGPSMKMVQESASLPTTIRVGGSTRFIEDRLLVSVDASKPNDNNASIHAGGEYTLTPMVALRGGYKLTPGASTDLGGLTGISAGLGITVNRFNFDYSVSPFGDLGISHRLSLLVRFGNRE